MKFHLNNLIIIEKQNLIAIIGAWNVSSDFNIKGYLRYKTITSQNVSSKAQIKNFFISRKNYVPFSRYSRFCIFNHSMMYQISDVTMSVCT